MAGRKIRAKAQMIAAHLLEVHDDDLEWDVDCSRVKGVPELSKTMTELATSLQRRVNQTGSKIAMGGRDRVRAILSATRSLRHCAPVGRSLQMKSQAGGDTTDTEDCRRPRQG
jgi:hypothetical protein